MKGAHYQTRPGVQPPRISSASETALSRRAFVRTILAGAAGLSLFPHAARGENGSAFSFLLLGDLHFDRLAHHDLEWLQRDKPDDLRQSREYSALTAEMQPRLFAALRERVPDLAQPSESRAAFVLQVGDFVEGLCGSQTLAERQDREAVEFVRAAGLGLPFLFTKGNHDITGAGAPGAFKNVFHPFLAGEAARLDPAAKLEGACYAVEYGGALFCFFDAYDKSSLAWLESVLARRTARHCFVVIHPPVAPYGARATWHVFSAEAERAQRDRMLELLGRHSAIVLSGHIHKHNLLVRAIPRGGRFLQFALSSVVRSPEPKPEHLLSGVGSYNGNQVEVEPAFSPATEAHRRAVYAVESPLVKYFEYADLPGYAVVSVDGPKVTARSYCGVTRRLWRAWDLTKVLAV